MSVLANKIAKEIRLLDSCSVPHGAICSHFGVHLIHANLLIQIGCRHRANNKTLITIYDRRCKIDGHVRANTPEWDGRSWAGQSSYIHQHRANAVASAVGVGIFDQWNGSNGNTGISVELDRICPLIVYVGIRNYSNMDWGKASPAGAEKGYSDFRAALLSAKCNVR